jgi:hypothetical protein
MDAIMLNLPQGVSWLVMIKMMQKHAQLYSGNNMAQESRMRESLSWSMEWLACYVEDPDGPNIDPEFKDNWDQAMGLIG